MHSQPYSSLVRHVLCTDIARDGMLSGPNLDLYATVLSRSRFPGILQWQASGAASGNCIGPLRAFRHRPFSRRERQSAAGKSNSPNGVDAILARRIIPCLDVRNGAVVKGVRFRDHEVAGDILELAVRYRDAGADELVFYDITASPEGRGVVDGVWVRRVAYRLDIPFCVAGGIRTLADAEEVLNSGADKISINSPALDNPTWNMTILKTAVDSRLAMRGGGY